MRCITTCQSYLILVLAVCGFLAALIDEFLLHEAGQAHEYLVDALPTLGTALHIPYFMLCCQFLGLLLAHLPLQLQVALIPNKYDLSHIGTSLRQVVYPVL